MTRSAALALLAAVLAITPFAPPATAQTTNTTNPADCEPHWDIHAFPPGRGIGPATSQGVISDAVTYDDGTGQCVYMSGLFFGVGGVRSPGIVKWDGKTWIRVSWENDPFRWDKFWITDLEVYKGALYANYGPDAPPSGCSGSSCYGQWISKWDGDSWESIADGWSSTKVFRMIVFDGGDGPELYAMADTFLDPSSQLASIGIARWNGSEWRSLGAQRSIGGSTLTAKWSVVDEIHGSMLYVVGSFQGVRDGDSVTIPATRSIAKWDGEAWSAVGTGLADNTGPAQEIAVLEHADGTHPTVYVGGASLRISEESAGHPLVAWDGTSWSEVPFPENSRISRLAVFDDGQGPKLYASGLIYLTPEQCIPLARLEGETWVPVLNDLFDFCSDIPFEALVPLEDERSSALYLFSSFGNSQNIARSGPVRWDGQSVDLFGDGLLYTAIPSHYVTSIEMYDDGQGDALYVSGYFSGTSENTAPGIARWSGTSWEPVSDSPQSGPIDSELTRFDDGAEDALYLTGSPSFEGETRHVLKWNGVEWSDLGNPIRKRVRAAEVFNDGSEDALYVAGEFSIADGSVADYIARWDGVMWSGVVGADPDGYQPSGLIRKLHVFDDGSGDATLYALGEFTAVTESGTQTANLARWNGTAWEPVGPQPPPQIDDIFGYDDGSGPMLYTLRITEAGSTLGGTAQEVRLSRLDESGWNDVATLSDGYYWRPSIHDPFSMTVFDDGSGLALYISASFENAEGVPASSIVRWNGQNFSALGSGIQSGYWINCAASAMKVHDDGSGPALFVGGTFTSAGGAGAGMVAKWQGCPTPPVLCPGDIDQNFIVDIADFDILATNYGMGPNATQSDGDLNGDGFVNLADFNLLAVNFGRACD